MSISDRATRLTPQELEEKLREILNHIVPSRRILVDVKNEYEEKRQ